MKKLRFIINPNSGASRKEHFADWIKECIDTSVNQFDIAYTKAPHHATEIAREAAEQAFDIVVVVGGDGSVNEAGAGLIGTQTAMGIIPTGSGNGLARHLGLPMDFKAAVSLLNNCTIDRIDTLLVNERFCAGTFGLGFDAHVAHLFAVAGTRGYSTYVKLVLTEFFKYPSRDFTIVADGKEYVKECFLLTFANSSQFGNNAVIAPFADIKDGIIDISILKKFPLITAPGLVYRMMNNSLHRSNYFDRLTGRDILVRNTGNIKGHIDGEPVELTGDIKIKMVPLSLNVAVRKHNS